MINRVVLVGRLTRDPELRKSTAGTSICTFTVAIDNRQKNADGSKSTSYIPVVVFSNSAETVAKYARKGLLVGVEGRLNQRSYVKSDNTKGSVIEVIADSVQFLERREPVENEEMEIPPFDDGIQDSASEDDSKNLDKFDLTDNDLPF